MASMLKASQWGSSPLHCPEPCNTIQYQITATTNFKKCSKCYTNYPLLITGEINSFIIRIFSWAIDRNIILIMSSRKLINRMAHNTCFLYNHILFIVLSFNERLGLSHASSDFISFEIEEHATMVNSLTLDCNICEFYMSMVGITWWITCHFWPVACVIFPSGWVEFACFELFVWKSRLGAINFCFVPRFSTGIST